MSTRHVVAILLRVYPKAWRAEYGAELAELLLAHELSVRIVADVLKSGASERIRRADPGVACGVAMFVVVTLGIVANVAAWPAFALDGATVLQASTKTLPTVIVKPFGSELYTLLLVGCGWWVVARRRGTVTQAGAAAVKLTFVAGLPVIVVGLLLWLGALELVVLTPGSATAPPEHVLAYSYYDAALRAPAPWAVGVAPLFALPVSWLWGMVGGKVARWTMRPHPRQV